MNEQILALGYALMAELAQQVDPLAPISSAKLCKRLGVRMSSVQRCLAYFADGVVANQPGLAWLDVTQQEDRLMLKLTAAGLAQWQAWQRELLAQVEPAEPMIPAEQSGPHAAHENANEK